MGLWPTISSGFFAACCLLATGAFSLSGFAGDFAQTPVAVELFGETALFESPLFAKTPCIFPVSVLGADGADILPGTAITTIPLLPLAGEGARRADEGVGQLRATFHDERNKLDRIIEYDDEGTKIIFKRDTLIRPVGHLLPQAGEGNNHHFLTQRR